MEINFKPADVNLSNLLADTFDRVEYEATAAVIVKVLADNGNVWRTADCHELANGFLRLTKDPGPWRDCFNNPFVKIDLDGCIKKGFVEWEGDKGIRFTEAGLARLRRRVPETPRT